MRKIIFYLLYSILFGSLYYGYFEFVVPLFGYNKFTWDPNITKIVESVLLLYFMLLFTPHGNKKPSDILLNFQLIFPIIGMLVMFGASDKPRLYTYMTVCLYLLILFIANHVQIKRVTTYRISLKAMQQLFIACAIIFIVSMFLFGAKSFLNFSFLKVYEFRTAAAENLPSIYGYLSPMMSKVVLPFILVVAVKNRQWLIAIISVLGSILMFALTSHKGPLFYPLYVLLIYYCSGKRNANYMILCGCISAILIPIIYSGYKESPSELIL